LTYFSHCKKRNEDATESFSLVTPLIAELGDSEALKHEKMSQHGLRFAVQQCILFLMLVGACRTLKRATLQGNNSPDLKRSLRLRSEGADLDRLPKSRFRAVTVLHQPCSTLSYTLTNFASNLGPEWPILVLHNDDVSPHLERNKIVRRQKRHGILRTASLERNGFSALSSANSSSYSKLLASTRFWSALRAQHVLIFQTDSVLCSMSPWSIDDFLLYDYIGAPWIDRWFGMDIGNGGLSLRKAKTMMRITKHFDFNETENEDIYFARGIYKLAKRDHAVKIPPIHVAAKFAYEAGRLPRVTSFGVHKTPFREVDKKAIAKTCPEATASVWGGCQVETYHEKSRGGVAQLAGIDQRFLAVDQRMTVLDFEADYSVSEPVPLHRGS
jgi:hypothetical protein